MVDFARFIKEPVRGLGGGRFNPNPPKQAPLPLPTPLPDPSLYSDPELGAGNPKAGGIPVPPAPPPTQIGDPPQQPEQTGASPLPEGFSYDAPSDRGYPAVMPSRGKRFAYGPQGERIEVDANLGDSPDFTAPPEPPPTQIGDRYLSEPYIGEDGRTYVQGYDQVGMPVIGLVPETPAQESARGVLDQAVGNAPVDLANDFNGDGRVTSADALAQLKADTEATAADNAPLRIFPGGNQKFAEDIYGIQPSVPAPPVPTPPVPAPYDDSGVFDPVFDDPRPSPRPVPVQGPSPVGPVQGPPVPVISDPVPAPAPVQGPPVPVVSDPAPVPAPPPVFDPVLFGGPNPDLFSDPEMGPNVRPLPGDTAPGGIETLPVAPPAPVVTPPVQVPPPTFSMPEFGEGFTLPPGMGSVPPATVVSDPPPSGIETIADQVGQGDYFDTVPLPGGGSLNLSDLKDLGGFDLSNINIGGLQGGVDPSLYSDPELGQGSSEPQIGTMGGPVYDEQGNLIGNLGSAGPLFGELGGGTAPGMGTIPGLPQDAIDEAVGTTPNTGGFEGLDLTGIGAGYIPGSEFDTSNSADTVDSTSVGTTSSFIPDTIDTSGMTAEQITMLNNFYEANPNGVDLSGIGFPGNPYLGGTGPTGPTDGSYTVEPVDPVGDLGTGDSGGIGDGPAPTPTPYVPPNVRSASTFGLVGVQPTMPLNSNPFRRPESQGGIGSLAGGG